MNCSSSIITTVKDLHPPEIRYLFALTAKKPRKELVDRSMSEETGDGAGQAIVAKASQEAPESAQRYL